MSMRDYEDWTESDERVAEAMRKARKEKQGWFSEVLPPLLLALILAGLFKGCDFVGAAMDFGIYP